MMTPHQFATIDCFLYQLSFKARRSALPALARGSEGRLPFLASCCCVWQPPLHAPFQFPTVLHHVLHRNSAQ